MPTIRERNGRFQVQVRVKETGRVVHQESATFDTRKQAELWGLSLERKLGQSGYVERAVELTTVRTVLGLHIETLASLGRGVRGFQTSFRLVESAHFIDRPAGHLRVEDITRWLGAMPGAPATRLHAVMTLRSVFRNASSMHGIPLDPAVLILATQQMGRLKVVGPSQKRDRRVTDDELDRIILASMSRESKLPMKTLVRLAVALPRRISELASMKWGNYTGDTLMLENTKSATQLRRDETIPVPPNARALIDSLPRVAEHILPFSAKYASNAFADAAEDAGLGEIRFHDLRHEGISRLFAAGLNIPEVSLISGHTSWATLKRYTHIKPSDVLEKLRAGTQANQKAPA